MVYLSVFLYRQSVEFIVCVILSAVLEYGAYPEVESLDSLFVEVIEQCCHFVAAFIIEKCHAAQARQSEHGFLNVVGDGHLVGVSVVVCESCSAHLQCVVDVVGIVFYLLRRVFYSSLPHSLLVHLLCHFGYVLAA